MIREGLYLLYALFFIYTWIYAIQWIIGFWFSIHELSKLSFNKMKTFMLVTDEVAKQNPVSVIIAAYNEEDCIVDTIESLMQEDYPTLEIIVVDDGSKDCMATNVIQKYGLEKNWCFGEKKPLEPCECYEQFLGNRHLILLQKQNGGKAKALNLGLMLCNGKYSLVLDADTKVKRGAIRAMVARFLEDNDTIVCAGAVGNDDTIYRKLNFFQRCLLTYQTLEYYRTFYFQRVFLDKLNANIVVSGAFALFDTEFLRAMGGYQENTIGEDMELTMRLHAFCRSQRRKYKISYTEEAKCTTQFPFCYRDFFRQRRRWQIGMLQSLWKHKYMLINIHYGIVGTFTCSIFLFYELLAPFIEICGMLTLIISFWNGILSVKTTLFIIMIYYILILMMEMILIIALDTYEAEKIPARKMVSIFMIGMLEFFTFHLLNSGIKIIAIFSRKKHNKTWQHISRA